MSWVLVVVPFIFFIAVVVDDCIVIIDCKRRRGFLLLSLRLWLLNLRFQTTGQHVEVLVHDVIVDLADEAQTVDVLF